LFQLPPNFKADADRLFSFVKLLSKKRDTASSSAIQVGTRRKYYGCLQQGISLCISDHHDAPAPWRRTADFVYVRGHGPTGRYKGHYSPKVLSEWARRIRS
jgi:uncharacterized protein YecE (DUF72 family)